MLQWSWDPLPKPTVPPSTHTSRPGLQGSAELLPTIPFLKLFPSLRDEKRRKSLAPWHTPSSVKCSPSPPLLFKTRGSGRKMRQPRFIIQIASCSANRDSAPFCGSFRGVALMGCVKVPLPPSLLILFFNKV